jgi:hypothetical protein
MTTGKFKPLKTAATTGTYGAANYAASLKSCSTLEKRHGFLQMNRG